MASLPTSLYVYVSLRGSAALADSSLPPANSAAGNTNMPAAVNATKFFMIRGHLDKRETKSADDSTMGRRATPQYPSLVAHAIVWLGRPQLGIAANTPSTYSLPPLLWRFFSRRCADVDCPIKTIPCRCADPAGGTGCLYGQFGQRSISKTDRVESRECAGIKPEIASQESRPARPGRRGRSAGSRRSRRVYSHPIRALLPYSAERHSSQAALVRFGD